MGGWVRDCYGGFVGSDPPAMEFQAYGPLRQAVGADIGLVVITLTVDADCMFNVNDLASLSIRSPVETFAILNALYDDTYTWVPFDFSLGGRWPAVLVPGPGVTVAPDTGKTLTFMPNWAMVWLLKTASNTYTLFGDLEPAS